MHIFSMTCKAESMLDLFGEQQQRQIAIKWFKEHYITKLYLESYRHGRQVPLDRLEIVRDDFIATGFEVGGCITPTNLSQRNGNPLVSCYSDSETLANLKQIVEDAARCFDFLIIDDFLFTDCTCDECQKLKKSQTWAQFRCEQMLDVSREQIIAPAKGVNPNVRIILKYPLWYEIYLQRGYHIIRETELYDQVWIGTETRDPDSIEAGRRPQTAACWIQGWMNDIAGEKCGGGWYDPIDTSPATYCQQARQTILGKAPESLLHCYDYLGTDTPGVAIHGKDLEIKHGRADAEAFRLEAMQLKKLADWLEDFEPRGVLVPKNPLQPPTTHKEQYLAGFTAMLGISMLPAASLRKCKSAFLSMQAYGFDSLADFISEMHESAMPLVITRALCEKLLSDGQILPRIICDSLDNCGITGDLPTVIYCNETTSILNCPEDLWQLTALEPEQLNKLRNMLLEPFDIEFDSPERVSLHLFGSEGRYCEAIENFNDFQITARLRFIDSETDSRKLALCIPGTTSGSIEYVGSGEYLLTIDAMSLVLLQMG